MLQKVLFFCLLCLGNCSYGYAQEKWVLPPIPIAREYHHALIVNSLQSIGRLKNKQDSLLPITGNASLDQSINQSIKEQVTKIRAMIELNSQLSDNDKFAYLRGLNELLTAFISGYQSKQLQGADLVAMVKAFEQAMHKNWNRESFYPIIREQSLEVGERLLVNFAFKNNPGMAKSEEILVLKACQRNPKNILSILTEHPNNPFADSLLVVAAKKNQELFYNYAAANNELGNRIRTVAHPLVRTIAKLAGMKTGRMYFPFLDNLVSHTIDIDSIKPFVENDSSNQYFSLLVKTRIEYVERMAKGDTPMSVKALTSKLQSKAVELYINEINALHSQENASIRFKKISTLSPTELYYIAVMGEEELYTSSFVNGVYPEIFKKMNHPSADTLLHWVRFDYFKKFIKLSAAYNTLNNFLARMEPSNAQQLMKDFVKGLEKTQSLEEAVDVADSYGSIADKAIQALILQQVGLHLKEQQQLGNRPGILIYQLLQTIFQSLNPANPVDLTNLLGIHSVYDLPNQVMANEAGRIIIQQFSYGDKDALVYFSNFISRFQNQKWKIVKKPMWVEISSQMGTPITIYANLPLDETKELDTQAQDSLIAYLAQQQLSPTMVIHRGHSYYLNETIKRLPVTAKLILLGSCGGYQKLTTLLNICPSAQIIASKQVAAGALNQRLIDAITEKMRLGGPLNWESIWQSVEKNIGSGYKEQFDDYIPPHRNLGAIFMQAFEKANQPTATE